MQRRQAKRSRQREEEGAPKGNNSKGKKANKYKKAKSKRNPPLETGEKLPEPPGRPAQGGEIGDGGGKEEEVAEGTAEALAVRAAQRGLEVPEQVCSQL